jgi:hypothetical protein
MKTVSATRRFGLVRRIFACAAFVLGSAGGLSAANAQVGRIEGEWRSQNGTVLTIWAGGVLGWRFRSSVANGWADQGLLPRTIEMGFAGGSSCWFLTHLSDDEEELRITLLFSWDRRCKLLVGDFV